MKNRTRSRGTRLVLSPVAVALLCVFPAAAQGATGLPVFKIDPALLNPPPPGSVQPYGSSGQPPSAPTPAPPAPQAEAPASTAARTPAKPAPRQAAAATNQPAPASPAAATSPAAMAAPAAAVAAADAAAALARRPEEETASGAGAAASPFITALATPPLIAASGGAPEDQPVYISAEHLQGHDDAEVEAEGKAELTKADQIVRGDYLTYFKPEDEVYAKGNVSLTQQGDTAEGPELRLKMDARTGYMETPTFRFGEVDGRGNAERMEFKGQDKFAFDTTNFTTCPIGDNDWYIKARQLDIDRTINQGIAHDATVVFKDTPILYAPWMSFALKKERKSGFLSPTFGTTGNNGMEFSLPYYWNIAPNYDATITPRMMAKRGFQLGSEFRYLQADYHGQVNYETLPNDQIKNTNRYLFNLQHAQSFGGGLSGGLNIQKVSDKDYFSDLSTTLALTSLSSLPREGFLTYDGGWWNATGRVQKWQFLSDAPVVSRTPQIVFNVNRQLYGSQDGVYATNFNLASEYVNFSGAPQLPDARRTTVYPSLSVPISAAYGYVTPKVGVHSTRYSFDRTDNVQAPPDTTVSVPIASLDSGLIFERDTSWFGNAFQQTLEPRAYYVYAPYRDQSAIPVYDTGDFGFGVPQIFSENRFVGNDRISDANQVTLGVTSRFIEPNGTERLRATVAQRYYFTPPRVTLPGQTPSDNRVSHFLAEASGRVSKAWWLDSFWEYNPELSRSENFNVSTRYQPETGKVLNASFRYTPVPTTTLYGINPDGFRQMDISGQWPIYGRWTGVGRWNYSILDKTTLEGVAGLEYDGGCWAARFVMHSLTTGPNQKSNAFFVQLELNGLSGVGSNPLEVLRQNIFGYTRFSER